MRTQLVAARAVGRGARRPRHRRPSPPGPMLEVAGPREERLVEMATLLARAAATPRRVEAPATRPIRPQTAYASGALLPGPGRDPRRADLRRRVARRRVSR